MWPDSKLCDLNVLSSHKFEYETLILNIRTV
jgi:hypothetical protein